MCSNVWANCSSDEETRNSIHLLARHSATLFSYMVLFIPHKNLKWAMPLLFSHWVACNPLQPHRLQHARLPCPSVSRSLLRFMSIELVMLSNHPILWTSFLLLPSTFPSIRVFSNSWLFVSHEPKCWEFQLGNGKWLQDSLPWEPHEKYVVKGLLNSSYPELLSMYKTQANFIYSLFP